MDGGGGRLTPATRRLIKKRLPGTVLGFSFIRLLKRG